MEKQETVKIMAMLSAFYAGSRNEPEQQAAVWHMVIGKYDYEIAKKAVLRFAENDTRDYATFPACGVIVAEIKKVEAEMERPIREVIHRIMTGLDYYGLSVEAQKLISEQQYNGWLNINAEEFATHTKDYADILRRRRDGASDGDVSSLTENVMKRLGSGF